MYRDAFEFFPRKRALMTRGPNFNCSLESEFSRQEVRNGVREATPHTSTAFPRCENVSQLQEECVRNNNSRALVLIFFAQE